MEQAEKIKVAQITAYRISYGSLLQTLATQIAFRKCGIQLELFCYEPSGKDNCKRRLLKIIRHPNVIINKVKEGWCDFSHHGYFESKRKRDKKFSDFLYQNIVCTDVINTEAQRDKRIQDYQIVLSGSDQTWNPINFGEKYFTCEFVPDSIKVVSYASSFGIEEIPHRQEAGTKHYLKRFFKISLRETSGREIVRRLTDRICPVVLDPTLLLKSDEWNHYVSDKRMAEDKYIFTYFLSSQEEFRKKAKELKEKTKFQVVTIPHVLQYIQDDIKFSDIGIDVCAPDEWLRLIRDAEYICTDSYHGMIFSIIFKKQFIVMKRFRDGSSVSANTRIYEVLDKLGLSSRLWNGGDIYSQIIQKINYDLVEEKLKIHRELSYKYIDNILNED